MKVVNGLCYVKTVFYLFEYLIQVLIYFSNEIRKPSQISQKNNYLPVISEIRFQGTIEFSREIICEIFTNSA